LSFDPTTPLLGCTAFLLGAALVASFVRWPGWAIGVYTTVQLWQSYQSVPGSRSGAGVDLLPTDVLTMCLLAASLIILARRRGYRAPLALLALLSLTACALLRGFGRFDAQTVGNEARTHFIQLLCVAFFVAVLSPGRPLVRTVARVWVAAACVLSLLALLWWLEAGIGSNSEQVMVDGVLTNARALGPAEALIIGQAAMFLLCGRGLAGPGFLAWPLLMVVVLMQHRTVWLAVGIMFIGWLLTRRHQRGTRLAALTVLGSLSTLGLLAVSWGVAEGVTSSLGASSEDDATLVWRVEGWLALLPRLDGVLDWLVGLPFGSGYDRMMNGVLITFSPHNYYLEVLLRLGLLGVAALLALYASAGRAAGADREDGLLIRLLICGHLVFMTTYPLFPEQAVILGLLAACARPRNDAPNPRTTQESPCPTKPHSSPASPVRTARI
jgi:hypothetical protein